MFSIRNSLAVALIATHVLFVPNIQAQQNAAPTLDPASTKIIKAMCDYIAGLKTFRVDINSVQQMTQRGLKQEMKQAYIAAVARPNRIAMTVAEGRGGITMVCDGKHIYSYLPMQDAYTQKTAPGRLEKLFDDMETNLVRKSMAPGSNFISSFFLADSYADIVEGVKSLKLLAPEKINGRKVNHIRIMQDRLDIDLWITADKTPVPVKFVPDFSRMLTDARKDDPNIPQDTSIEMTITFDNWQMNKKLPDSLFAFTAPTGAKHTDSFLKKTQPSGHPLLGKPAPNFELNTLAGKTLKPDAFKGKKILILDFWATWCGPCARALPILTKVAKEFEKDVAFFAVNLQEKPAIIKAFQQKRKLEFAVALDTDASVANKYGVEGIPQTVIIDKDGIVQAVHVGVKGDLESQLKGELNALLAGKTLVDTAPAK